ncbi:hypothetical protein U14_01924 [Candidatus Moduliflexus flocculans]|uniref:Uncharacterized protein n=1 Tax=Candidatus Moduliflexus flocculans TaxID=1499966 RepID=A0A0S6VYT7_9BACT|nr:hypothetical protein U14_01924 [Candidatus Moduliflexus flocculans]
MSLKLIVSLQEIEYSGESIGRDFDFTIEIDGTQKMLHQHIQLGKQGKTRKSIEEVLFTQQNVPLDATIQLPVKVAIRERDQNTSYDEQGSGESIFPVNIIEAKKQSHTLEVHIVATHGSDKGKEACFLVKLEAMLIDEEVAQCLKKFEDTIGQYSAIELNEALVTIFGELSETLHERLSEEAEAIASTIFNRKMHIEETRLAYTQAEEQQAEAVQAYKTAAAVYEDLTRNLTKYRRELGEEEYAHRVSAAKEAFNQAKQARKVADNTLVDASSEKLAAEFFVSKSKRSQPITLTDIVALHSQYEGTRRGKMYVKNYPGWTYADQKRNCKRWQAGKVALSKLAQSTELRAKYLYFITNNDGKLPLKSGRVRIGGNDF